MVQEGNSMHRGSLAHSRSVFVALELRDTEINIGGKIPGVVKVIVEVDES